MKKVNDQKSKREKKDKPKVEKMEKHIIEIDSKDKEMKNKCRFEVQSPKGHYIRE